MFLDSPSSPTSMATTNSLRKGKEYYGDRHLDVKSTHLHGPCYYWHLHIKLLLHCIILLLLLSHSYSEKKPDGEVKTLFDIKNALNDTNGRLADWNIYMVSPCYSWSHVICDHKDGNVVSLSLGSLGLSGTLSNSITELKFLTSLDLHDNNISGELPDLSNLVNLENLNLTRNKFSGSIPTSWDQLSNLKYLDLSSNNLTGKIPEKLFSASVYNFTGTSLDCGTSLHQPCVSSSSVSGSPNKSKLKFVTIGASCGALVLLLFGAIFLYQFKLKRKLDRDFYVDVEGEDSSKLSFGQLRRFSWREIQLATDNFNENNIIGRGGFGKVYKGVIADNTKVAIKRLTDYQSPGGEAAFLREVELISVAVHRNLLRLIGFSTTSYERVLVYPFMQNLSVAYHLRDLKPGEKGLDWATRKRIAFGAARGLEYLHEHCTPKIIHRDLKAANILLDDNFEPVLGDFGLAKLVDSSLTHITTQIRGTMGHIAPEYLSTGKSSEKTDVFGYDMAQPDTPSVISAFKSHLEREKLTGKNFNDWYRSLRIVLRSTGKMDYLTEECPAEPAASEPEAVKAAWRVEHAKFNEVACLMLTSMSAQLQKKFEYFFPKDMLDVLRQSYEKPPAVELYDELDKLHNCKHGDGKPVEDYVTEMKESFDQLHRIGFGYPDNVQVHLINRSLNKDFAGFVQNFNMHCSGKTVSELLALLIEYEKSLPAKVKNPTPQVLAIHGGRIQKKSHVNKGKGKVNKGKQVMAYQPEPKMKQHQPKQKKVNPPNKKDQACHHCHEKGHWKRNCPLYIHDLRLKKQGNEAGNPSSSELRESWPMDNNSCTLVTERMQELKL